MIGQLPDVRDVAVIGGGYIGLEAAAVLSKLGKKVVVLEMLDRVLSRVAAEPISRFFEAEHRAHGVDIRTGAAVQYIDEKDGAACAVKLGDGSSVGADLVIVGIGIDAAVEPLIEAGAAGVHIGRVESSRMKLMISITPVWSLNSSATSIRRSAIVPPCENKRP